MTSNHQQLINKDILHRRTVLERRAQKQRFFAGSTWGTITRGEPCEDAEGGRGDRGGTGMGARGVVRECHGQPWGFLRQPAPVPVQNRARTYGRGLSTGTGHGFSITHGNQIPYGLAKGVLLYLFQCHTNIIVK